MVSTEHGHGHPLELQRGPYLVSRLLRFRPSTRPPFAASTSSVLLFAGLAPKVERGHIRIIAGTIRDTTTAAQKKRLRTILAKRISLEPKSSNLPRVLNLLSSLTGLPVVLDPNVAAEARKIKINEKFTKVPCSSALRRILKISSMKWRYMHGMIQVYK